MLNITKLKIESLKLSKEEFDLSDINVVNNERSRSLIDNEENTLNIVYEPKSI